MLHNLTGPVDPQRHMMMPHALTAILPCNDLDASEAFYARLGFTRTGGAYENYRILADRQGGNLHLNKAVEGWLTPGRNPFGLYLYTEDVDALAAEFKGEIIEKEGPSDKRQALGHVRVRRLRPGPDAGAHRLAQ
jgi:hypothetical protein